MNYQWFGFIGMALLLVGCGGSDSRPKNPTSSSAMAMSSMVASSPAPSSSAMASSSMAAMTKLSYSIRVTNLTAAQPLSPFAYALHEAAFKPFTIGMPASVGVEMIAESGATADYIAEARANGAVMVADTTMGMTMPGEYREFTLNAMVPMGMEDQVHFSVLSMLVNTNDALTGLNSIDLRQLAIGQSWTFNTLSYDAGTEKNTELPASIPGPAAGGEGFNAQRDDMVNQVTMHPGVITQDDGKADSVLNQAHRWDNPVARITVTRLAP
jgi:hypothetical protein